MDVYWLEQTEADLPAVSDWLSASEEAHLNGMRFAKRRADWRLGRWTAKRALAAYLKLPGHPQALRGIEIRPTSSGAPEAFLAGRPAAATISLSHRAGTAVCAVTQPHGALGCDLEVVEPRNDAFVTDYFTAEEQALVAASKADRFRILALLWSAKESTLKALREGLRLDPRCLIVRPVDVLRRGVQDRAAYVQKGCAKDPGANGWRPLAVRYTEGQIFRGWWQEKENFLRTMVAAPSPAWPIPLKVRN